LRKAALSSSANCCQFANLASPWSLKFDFTLLFHWDSFNFHQLHQTVTKAMVKSLYKADSKLEKQAERESAVKKGKHSHHEN
jgi:hypothetical protein